MSFLLILNHTGEIIQQNVWLIITVRARVSEPCAQHYGQHSIRYRKILELLVRME